MIAERISHYRIVSSILPPIFIVSGKMLGRFEVRAHELAVAPDGTLLPATRDSQLYEVVDASEVLHQIRHQ
jgi:hypothetical protein